MDQRATDAKGPLYRVSRDTRYIICPPGIAAGALTLAEWGTLRPQYPIGLEYDPHAWRRRHREGKEW